MFGRRQRENAQAIEALRGQLSAADARARALSEALVRIESRVSNDADTRERLHAMTENVIATLRDSTLDQAADMSRALGQVANLCAVVAERLEADQLERRALVGVLAESSQSSARRLEAPTQTIGGTVFASPASPDREISVVEDDERTGPALDADASADVRVVLECLTEAVYRHNARDSRV